MQNDLAVEALCRNYWNPLYGYIRQRGYPRQEAEDLAQEFFARLLGNNTLHNLTRKGGEYFYYLLTALKNFLTSEWRRKNAKKRLGDRFTVPLDDAGEELCCHQLLNRNNPAKLCERRAVARLLERTLQRLGREYGVEGKAELFRELEETLPGPEHRLAYTRIAQTLRMSEPAVRMAAHRLRRRFGELLRAEVAREMDKSGDVDEEIRFMLQAISN